jgi:glycosyltransferase involved in cell wall biosynthesis
MESNPLALYAVNGTSSFRPIRVLFLIPESPSRASMIFVHRQVASLRAAGLIGESFLLASRTSARVLAAECLRLRGTIRRFQPDLLHAQYGTMTAFLAAMCTSIPLVVTYRGSDLNPDPGVPWLRRFAGGLFSQIAAQRARQIICVSDQLKERLWVGRHRTTVIPTGVDTELFYPRPRQEARAQLGWGKAERVILFNAGRNPRLKRIDLAQAAVDYARTMCGQVRLVVFDGDVSPDRIPVMMSAADCLLQTSNSEGSPNVIKEAMACNLPVVSVDVGDTRKRLEGVWPSWIVGRDVEEIGKALSVVLKLGRRSNGRTKVQAVASQAVAQQILAVYRKALASPAHQNLEPMQNFKARHMTPQAAGTRRGGL